MAGMKHDTGKARMDLIPPEVLLALGEILAFGAEKYSERNWESGFEWGRAYAALQRHLLAWTMGEELDPETKKPHLWHAACNIAFLVAFTERNVGRDDRSPYFVKAATMTGAQAIAPAPSVVAPPPLPPVTATAIPAAPPVIPTTIPSVPPVKIPDLPPAVKGPQT